MKKFIKNNLKLMIGLIIGAILTGGIVYAATSAKEVTYTTAKNGNIKNVEEALNDLYNLNNNINCIRGTYTHTNASDEEHIINLNFIPKQIVIFQYVKEKGFVHILTYNANYSNIPIGTGYYLNGTGEKAFDVSSYLKINNNNFSVYHPKGTYIGDYNTDVYWLASN